MSEQKLNLKRSKLIDTLCGFSPIFVMSVFTSNFKDLSWWRYLIGAAIWMIIAGLYSALFKRFFCPEDVDSHQVSNSRKILYYVTIFLIGFVGITVFTFLPFDFWANLAISIVVNFVLTMIFCYYVARSPKE